MKMPPWWIVALWTLVIGGAVVSHVAAQETPTPEAKQIAVPDHPGETVDANVPAVFAVDVKVDAPTGLYAIGPMYAQPVPDKGFVRVTPCDNLVVMCQTFTYRMDQSVVQGDIVALTGE